ncbi:MAG TPA: Fic family protein [Bacillota bacterium]|nr:Fic family protein [Bacillota bacterium]
MAAEAAALRESPLSAAALRSLVQWFRLQHVYNSNAIEGSTLTLSETKVIVEDGLTVGGKSLREHAEAVNLAVAVDAIFEMTRSLDPPLSAGVIRDLHLLVLRDIQREEAGRYRREPVRISGSAYPTTEPLHIEEAMAAYDAWLTTDSQPADPILRAALAHTWLVNIHPFIDGNGRVARLAMNVVLLRAGCPLATIWKEDRPRYYDALETSHSGDLSDWIVLLADRVRDSVREYRRAQDEAERARRS